MTHKLHPQAEALLNGPLRVADPHLRPDLHRLRQTSANLDEQLVGPGEPVFRTWDTKIGIHGREITLRWYQPTEDAPELLTVFVHGGGWVNGTLDSYDALCRSLALRSGGGVVSVGYSLSPEARFPVALVEVEHILRHVAELALGAIGPITRFAAAGDSAGGNLLAGALHRMAEFGQHNIASAAFIYPVTDASLSHESWRSIGTAYNLTEARMRWYWEQYLGDDLDRQGQTASPEVSPLQSDRLHLFPRSLVITATHDPLHDEGAAFFKRLQEAGVHAQHLDVPGQIHGFLRLRRAMTDPHVGSDGIMERIGRFLQS